MGTQATPLDENMPVEIDFSEGTRGKFYRHATRICLPVYLDDHVQATHSALPCAKGGEFSALVNALLSKDLSSLRWGGELHG